MKSSTRVASPPSKPLLIYDGGCRFCVFWVNRWRRRIGSRIDFVPLQSADVARHFPEIEREQLETAVHLIEPDGTVHAAAAAVFRAVNPDSPGHPWARLYFRSPVFARAAECCYRIIARNRRFFSWLTKLIWPTEFRRTDSNV